MTFVDIHKHPWSMNTLYPHEYPPYASFSSRDQLTFLWSLIRTSDLLFEAYIMLRWSCWPCVWRAGPHHANMFCRSELPPCERLGLLVQVFHSSFDCYVIAFPSPSQTPCWLTCSRPPPASPPTNKNSSSSRRLDCLRRRVFRRPSINRWEIFHCHILQRMNCCVYIVQLTRVSRHAICLWIIHRSRTSYDNML